MESTRTTLNPMQQIVAETLRYCDNHCDSKRELEIVEWVTEHMADAIAREYPRFDKIAFLQVAGWVK
jgi:hypothetical protein